MHIQPNKQSNAHTKIDHIKLISIVVPIYNEEANIPFFYHGLCSSIKKISQYYNFEIIFVDDGSKDASWDVLKKISLKDCSIQALRLSRNFGHQMALTAGYDVAQGDAVVSMDSDMQDPPLLILDMINQWEQGAQVVYARRIERNDSFLKNITAQGYYWFLSHVADVDIPRSVGDFRLIDKKVLNVLRKCRERSRYLRGMVAWTGWKHAFVDFKRPSRKFGKTGYPFHKMVKFAFDGIANFSIFPLKIAAFVGVFVIATGIMMFLYIVHDALFYDVRYPLFKWLTTIIYIFMGVQFLLIWLLGEYLGRIYEQQKGRPLYIVAQKIGNKGEVNSLD